MASGAAAVPVFLFLFSFILIGTTCGQLYADEVSDGPCTDNTVAANFTACLPLILTPKVFTVNFASKALYRNYAESFLGRPAKDQAELDAMCYTFAFIEAIAIQSGYGTKTNVRTAVPTDLKLTLTGSPFGLGKFKINTTLAQSPGSTVTNQFETVDQLIWCDLNHALLVRCVNGTRQDWKLASVGDPAPWVFPIVLRIIESLGMPPANAVEYKSVSQGGTCPAPSNLFAYIAQAVRNVGGFIPNLPSIPIPSIPFPNIPFPNIPFFSRTPTT